MTKADGDRSERFQLTHRSIINTAADLFYNNGIHKTGVDAICNEVGITKATLYGHFESKAHLIAECIKVLDARYYDWFVREVTSRTDDAVERIKVVFGVLDDWFKNDSFRGCAFMNATIELADSTHPARIEVMAHKKRTVDYLEELAAGIGARDAHRLAVALMLLMEGAIITALVQEDQGAALTAGAVAAHLIEAELSAARLAQARA